MKTKLKSISFILTFVLTFMFTTSYADFSNEQILSMYDEALENQKACFSDLETVPWAVTPITELTKRGIVAGTGNNMFSPDQKVTRAQFIKLIVATCGITDPAATSNYADVNSEHWAYVYVSSALKAGLTDIYDSKTLEPDTPVTREDICYMSVKALEYAGCSQTGIMSTKKIFADENEMSTYALKPIYYLASLEVINGRDNGNFSPKDSATRAESAKIIYNILKHIEKIY